MAHHKDISKAHAQLEGEGWHIEYHREAVVTSSSRKHKKKHTATKRDKRRCIHYNKLNKQCRKLKLLAWVLAAVHHIMIDFSRYFYSKLKRCKP